MKDYRLEFHPDFYGDVRGMAKRIASQGSPLNAERWSERVVRFCYNLDTQPVGFVKVHDGPPRPAYQTPFERTRLVFYEVFDDEQVVRVLYLWHAARRDRPDLVRQWDPLDV